MLIWGLPQNLPIIFLTLNKKPSSDCVHLISPKWHPKGFQLWTLVNGASCVKLTYVWIMYLNVEIFVTVGLLTHPQMFSINCSFVRIYLSVQKILIHAKCMRCPDALLTQNCHYKQCLSLLPEEVSSWLVPSVSTVLLDSGWVKKLKYYWQNFTIFFNIAVIFQPNVGGGSPSNYAYSI